MRVAAAVCVLLIAGDLNSDGRVDGADVSVALNMGMFGTRLSGILNNYGLEGVRNDVGDGECRIGRLSGPSPFPGYTRYSVDGGFVDQQRRE